MHASSFTELAFTPAQFFTRTKTDQLLNKPDVQDNSSALHDEGWVCGWWQVGGPWQRIGGNGVPCTVVPGTTRLGNGQVQDGVLRHLIISHLEAHRTLASVPQMKQGMWPAWTESPLMGPYLSVFRIKLELEHKRVFPINRSSTTTCGLEVEWRGEFAEIRRKEEKPVDDALNEEMRTRVRVDRAMQCIALKIARDGANE
ncbi:hypothetical protein K438DRAFT_1764841 [Mycena galopus ATCC 62051]|nr:hypothetical protein K438DRAFT_1764841 [Mycena galopus ATCC 62051]